MKHMIYNDPITQLNPEEVAKVMEGGKITGWIDNKPLVTCKVKFDDGTVSGRMLLVLDSMLDPKGTIQLNGKSPKEWAEGMIVNRDGLFRFCFYA